MADPILGIGISGLNAAQAALQTASHNITNVNTPGYSRQVVVQTTNIPQYTGAGFLGRGVSVTDVQRSYNAFLQAQSWQAQASSSQLQTFSDQIGQVDSLLGTTSNGLSSSMSAFFNSVHDVASNPADMSARQTMLSQAQALSGNFQQASGQLDAQRANVSSQLGSAISQVNGLATQIANLNNRIVTLTAGASGQGGPNDLLDQRDQLVSNLSQLINTQVTVASDGSYNVLIGNGQPLVLEGSANRLGVIAGDPDPGQTQVVIKGTAGTVKLRDGDLSGGQIGGLLSFRDSALNPTQNALGQIAMTLAASFNNQNKLGQDSNGAMGGNVFTVGQPTVLAAAANAGSAVPSVSVGNYGALTASDYQLSYDGTNYAITRLSDGNTTTAASLPQTVDGLVIGLASGSMAAGDKFLIEPTRAGAAAMATSLTNPAGIAAALPIQASVAIGNTGGVTAGSLTVNGPPLDPNLRQGVTITFTSPTTFNVSGTGTGNPTGLAYVAGGFITYNGWTLQLNGTPAAGDSLSVGSNTGASGDNRNALLLAGLQSSPLVNGTTTLQDTYAQLVSSVGNQAQTAQTGATAQAAVLSNVQKAQASVSGVNLDEEAANLLRYQQAYQACGKVIAIAGTLFDTILKLEG